MIESLKSKILEYDRKYFKGNIHLYHKSPKSETFYHIREMTKRPIIIGGCGRSGTTLMLSMLSTIPSIYAIPKETGAFCKSNYQDFPKIKEDFRINEIYNWLLESDVLMNKRRWCEKTPKNVHRINEIIEYFGENVRIINIVRDGRDVITSMHPSKKNEYWITPERWIEDVCAGLSCESLKQVCTVRYEDLVFDYKKIMNEVCNHIDEEYVPSIDNYPYSSKIKVSTAWFENAKKIHSNSTGRWKKKMFKDRIETLMENNKAVELLRHYQYL